MDIVMNVIHWATSANWGEIILLAFAVLGALDAFLLALLALSNKLWPEVTWDDNIVTLLHGWLSKAKK